MDENPKKCRENRNLKKLKESYEALRKLHKLPDFKFMNENFEIENIGAEDTELLAKAIRKHMTEKIFYVFRSLEMFINPQNAPMFMFDIIKSFTETDKAVIKRVHKKIMPYEIEAFGLEAIYDEKKEADFIRNLADDWKEISLELGKIYLAMKRAQDAGSKKAEKSYVG